MGDGVKIACKSVANCFFCRHTWPGFASGHPALLCEIIMTQVIYLFKVSIVSTSLSVQNILIACLIDWMNELHSNLRPFFSSSLLILTLRNLKELSLGGKLLEDAIQLGLAACLLPCPLLCRVSHSCPSPWLFCLLLSSLPHFLQRPQTQTAGESLQTGLKLL